MIKVIQLSDTHLSDIYGFFYDNFCLVAEEINALKPDLVINTGDLSLNGPDRPQDLEFARWCHGQIEAPVLYLPGNHDIGEEPGAEELGQPMNQNRLNVYHALYERSYWYRDVEKWRLIGINSQLLGTGLSEEAEQSSWLEETLQSAQGPVGLFIHKPWFLESPDEVPSPLETVAPSAVTWLQSLIDIADVRFVASGHLHQYRSRTISGIHHHWCPSTAHVNTKPKPGADPALGFLQYTFELDTYRVERKVADRTHPYTFGEILQHGRYKRLMDVPHRPVDVDWK